MSLPRLVTCSGRVWAHLSEDTRQQILEEGEKAIQMQAAGKIEWSEELVRLIGLLQDGQASKSDVAAFWVRLHGVLEIILDDHVSRESFEPQNPVQERMLRVVREIDERARILLECVRDDERIFVEYERHRASHPFLDTYFLRFRGETPVLRTTRECGLVGRQVPLSEIRKVLQDFESQGPSEAHASSLAHRVARPARAYLDALTAKYQVFEPEP